MKFRVLPTPPTLGTELTGIALEPSAAALPLPARLTPPVELPPAPRTLAETGLPPLLLVDLLLKVMHLHALRHLQEIAQHLRLGVPLLDELMQDLRRESLVEVRRRGELDGDVQFELTSLGRARALEALSHSAYSGAAPVPLGAYAVRVQAQSVTTMGVNRAAMDEALSGVVVPPALRDQLGAAMNSQRAILLYGPAGAGKTFLCEQMARLLTGHIAVPHAVEVGGEIVRVYDPLVHRPARHEPAAPRSSLDLRQRADDRWVLCERPVVISGGELTLEMLDLVFDPRAGFYQAPPHFKANNGLFLVDDLGRQLVTPRQLLNRWIVPMAQRRDFLMLRNGAKFQIPFDTLLFFSTNLHPAQVADEAFLRRIGYKIRVGELSRDEYRRVMREACTQHGVPYTEQAFEALADGLHGRSGRPLLACYPRDLVSQIADSAAYRGERPVLTPARLEWAWDNYFAGEEPADSDTSRLETMR